LRNSTAVYLTVVGGVFYVIGGALVVSLAGALSGFGNLDSFFPNTGALITPTTTPLLDTSGLNDIVYAVGGFGILAGVLMIVGGILMGAELPGRRKVGSILAIIMLVLGALPALGGLLIGFILAAIGCYMGLTYKASRSNFTVGLGPVGSVTLGPQSPPASSSGATSEAGQGPLNYCIKCGSRLRDGAVFCGACGARVPE
jgi:zinc-ribbon domain